MLTATKVVALFLAGVTTQTSLRNLFRSLVCKGDDFRLVAIAVDVGLAWSMTRFAAGRFVFPATQPGQGRVSRGRVRLERVFVAGRTRVAADVVVGCGFVVIGRTADRLLTLRTRLPHEYGKG